MFFVFLTYLFLTLLFFFPRDSSAVTPVEVHVDAQNPESIVEAAVREQMELNSNLQEYYQLVTSASEKVDSAIIPHPSCNDCLIYPALRLKLTKSCKKRHRSSTVPEDVESDFQKNSDSVSLHCESHFLQSHVHFNELKECCVSYIDESPSADSLVKPSESSSDTEVFVSAEGKNCRRHHSICNQNSSACGKLPGMREVATPKRHSNVKCVTRSISFCNSCTSTHKSCCPFVFEGETEGKKRDRHNLPDGSYSVMNALSNRAYKVPRSMQDISVEATAKDNLICSPSLPTVVPASVRPKLESIRDHNIFSQLSDDFDRGLDFCQHDAQSCTKINKQEKDNRTFLIPESDSLDANLSYEDLESR